jgi:hypothetical protein
MVLNPRRIQEAVNPEPVAARLVTADHRSASTQSESSLCPANLFLHGIDIACFDVSLARPLPGSGAEPQLPFAPPEFEREKQNLITFLPMGHLCGLHGSSLVDVISHESLAQAVREVPPVASQ